MTPAGLDLARRLFPRATVAAAPLDLAPIVARALDAAAPRLLVIVETELWPELILAARARGVPVALVSARVSDRTERAYRRAGFLFGPALRAMSAIGAQTDTDRSRLVAIGADPDRVQVTGNVKLDPPEVPRPRSSLAEDRSEEAGADRSLSIDRIFASARPLLVAGSTHAGEEAAALDAWAVARIETPDLTLVIAPRHLARLPGIEAFLAMRGVEIEYRTKLEGPLRPGARVVVLDTIGELDALYAHADVAFVGGSLAPVGGHNVLEPARHGRPVLFGPHMDNFRAEADLLLRAGGAERVSDAAELAREARALIADRDRAARMGEAGRRALAESRGATERTLALLAPWLPVKRDA
jgi:3-deoxy-D-manno-octulosonic-acid transferase